MVASKNKTAAEKRFQQAVSLFAMDSNFLQEIYGQLDSYDFHLDHFLGAQAKRKVGLVSKKVGEYAVHPVPIILHDVHSNHPNNITNHKNKFIKAYGTPQSIWFTMIQVMYKEGYLDEVFKSDFIDSILRG